MQESHPEELTRRDAELIGKLRKEYFTDEAKMGSRREELRSQGEKVLPAIRLTGQEMLARASVILFTLTTETDHRIRKALRDELSSLAYALSDLPR